MLKLEATKSTVTTNMGNVIRYMTLVKIPPSADIKQAGKYDRTVKFSDDGCSYQPFYLSSGTSVSEGMVNFPNVWFPFYRISNVSWIRGATGLGNTAGRVYNIVKRLNGEENWGMTPQVIYSFLSRFEFFWQIKISARMNTPPNEELYERGYAWNQMLKFKNFILTHNYDEENKTFFPETCEVLLIPSLPIGTLEGKEEINEWLKRNDALCLEEREDDYVAE